MAGECAVQRHSRTITLRQTAVCLSTFHADQTESPRRVAHRELSLRRDTARNFTDPPLSPSPCRAEKYQGLLEYDVALIVLDVEYCHERVCVSVCSPACLWNHKSNLRQIIGACRQVAVDRLSSGGVAIRYVLPVLYYGSNGIRVAIVATPLQRRSRANTLAACILFASTAHPPKRRPAAPRLDKSFVQGDAGAGVCDAPLLCLVWRAIQSVFNLFAPLLFR